MYDILLVIASGIALFIVSITMFARANDLRWRKGFHWNVRLVGFVMAGVAPVGVVGYDFAMGQAPSPYETLFRVGVALVFLTTPNLPPWMKWIGGSPDAPPVEMRDDRRTGMDRRRNETP